MFVFLLLEKYTNPKYPEQATVFAYADMSNLYFKTRCENQFSVGTFYIQLIKLTIKDEDIVIDKLKYGHVIYTYDGKIGETITNNMFREVETALFFSEENVQKYIESLETRKHASYKTYKLIYIEDETQSIEYARMINSFCECIMKLNYIYQYQNGNLANSEEAMKKCGFNENDGDIETFVNDLKKIVTTHYDGYKQDVTDINPNRMELNLNPETLNDSCS